jgi:DNA ligase-1
MSLLECDSESVLYTGDFKLRCGLSAEPCEPRHANVLIMERLTASRTIASRRLTR